MKVPDTAISALLRQSIRYQVAAEQDTSPVIRFLHSAYAVAFLDAARGLAANGQIVRAIGSDVKEYRHRVMKFQDQVTRELDACILRASRSAA